MIFSRRPPARAGIGWQLKIRSRLGVIPSPFALKGPESEGIHAVQTILSAAGAESAADRRTRRRSVFEATPTR